MSITLSSYQHCIVLYCIVLYCIIQRWATISNNLMCTLHNFYSNKARFIHTSTVTRLHSCPGKKYAYALRASCLYIETNILEKF